MRELDLEPTTEAHAPAPETGPVAGGDSSASAVTLSIDVIGAGRAGTSLSAALFEAGHDVRRPLTRGQSPRTGLDAVLICVPDASIGEVDAAIPAEVVAGHCAGASPASLLARPDAFSLHPLMTLDGSATALTGAYAAIDATTEKALAVARAIAAATGMTPIEVAASDRAAYHAAASIASNFLTTLEGAAERLALTAGVPREALVPLVSRTVSNWAQSGASATLTGPIARGDTETVGRQRLEVEERTPDLIPMFDALCAATAELADPGAATEWR